MKKELREQLVEQKHELSGVANFLTHCSCFDGWIGHGRIEITRGNVNQLRLPFSSK